MKEAIIYLLLVFTAVLFHSINAYAATIELMTGVSINGKLIERTKKHIIMQDPYTKDKKKIKNELILSLTLYPSDEQDEEKITQQGASVGDYQKSLNSVLQPMLGLQPGMAYPFGKLGNSMKLGYGAHLFFDLQMPMTPQIFKIRLGVSAGYLYHQTKSSDFAPFIHIIPVVIYMKMQFITQIGLRPYLKLGGGITPVLSSGGNSFDPTAAASLGLGYINNKLPFIEFYIEAGMMMAFEKIRGDFITASVGVAYRFGAPRAETVAVNKRGAYE